MDKYIGSYNIEDIGEAWENNICYRGISFSRFDENEKEIERKFLYFCCNVPDFKTDEQITEFLKGKKNNQRINTVNVMYR